MYKRVYFDRFDRAGWPSLAELQPYFLAPKGQEWFYSSGNDGGGLYLEGVHGTENFEESKGRIDVHLLMYGDPNLGVLLIYCRHGGGFDVTYSSKGDNSHIREWVRTLHNDPMPVGLYIPFAEAWNAVKEFIETDGELPKSISWIANKDLPENTFPDPDVVLPGEKPKR